MNSLNLAVQDAPTSRRRISWRLFRYVLTDFLIILACCVAAFLTLFLFAALVDDLGDFMEHGAPTGQVIRYFLLLQPQYLGQVLPMALLLSSIWVISRMCRHNELTAIRAGGSSLLQAALPILVSAGVLTVMQAYVAEYVAPNAARTAEELHQRLTDPDEAALLDMPQHLAYRNRVQRREWLFRDFNPEARCKGVLVTQFREGRFIDWELRAAGAEFEDGKWVFYDAIFTRFDAESEFPTEPPRQIARLTTPDAELGIPALDDNPTRLDYLFKLRMVDSLSVPTIWRILQEPKELISPTTRKVLRTYLTYRLAFPISCILAVLIGIPMAVNYGRGGAMKSVMIAIGIMVGFYVCSEVLLVFGKAGYLPPELAGLCPAVIFAVFGVFLFKRKL